MFPVQVVPKTQTNTPPRKESESANTWLKALIFRSLFLKQTQGLLQAPATCLHQALRSERRCRFAG